MPHQSREQMRIQENLAHSHCTVLTSHDLRGTRYSSSPFLQRGISHRITAKKGFANTLTRVVVKGLVSEGMQLPQDLVHGLLFVLELLKLCEFDIGSCGPRVQASVGPGCRMKERPVLRWTNSMGSPRPAHFSREGKALCLATVVWHRFGLQGRSNRTIEKY